MIPRTSLGSGFCDPQVPYPHCIDTGLDSQGIVTDKTFTALVKVDAVALFHAHQDVFDDWREPQPAVPMEIGHEEPCSACGALLYVIGDRDVLCRSCDLWDHSWNHL